MTDTRNRLAGLVHSQWSGWMEYLFSRCTFEDDGTAWIPAWAIERWQRQMKTSFVDLPPDEQQSDLREVDRILAVLEEEDYERDR